MAGVGVNASIGTLGRCQNGESPSSQAGSRSVSPSMTWKKTNATPPRPAGTSAAADRRWRPRPQRRGGRRAGSSAGRRPGSRAGPTRPCRARSRRRGPGPSAATAAPRPGRRRGWRPHPGDLLTSVVSTTSARPASSSARSRSTDVTDEHRRDDGHEQEDVAQERVDQGRFGVRRRTDRRDVGVRGHQVRDGGDHRAVQQAERGQADRPADEQTALEPQGQSDRRAEEARARARPGRAAAPRRRSRGAR